MIKKKKKKTGSDARSKVGSTAAPTMPKKRRRVNRGLPSQEETYSNEKHGRADSLVPQSDYTINTDLCRVRLIRPSAKKGPLVFRPWPALDLRKPEELLQPGRVGPAPTQLGQWLVRVPCAAYVGLGTRDCPSVTFLLYQPGDKEGAAENPYRKLYFAAKSAKKSGRFGNSRKWDADWNKLLGDDAGAQKALPPPDAKWYIQGQVYRNGESDYLQVSGVPLGAHTKDDLVVVTLSKSAGRTLMEMFAETKEDVDGIDPDAPASSYLYGDPTGAYNADEGTVKGGWIFTLWCPKDFRAYKPKGKTSWTGKIPEFPSYEVDLRTKYLASNGEVFRPSLGISQTQMVFEKSQFWFPDRRTGQEYLLHFPSIEEQCYLIARSFADVSKLLQFAWADDWSTFATDEVKAVIAKRTQARVPGPEDDEEEFEDDVDVVEDDVLEDDEDDDDSDEDDDDSDEDDDDSDEDDDDSDEDDDDSDEDDDDSDEDDDDSDEDDDDSDEDDDDSDDEDDDDSAEEDDDDSDDEDLDADDSDDEKDVVGDGDDDYGLDDYSVAPEEASMESEEFDPEKEVDSKMAKAGKALAAATARSSKRAKVAGKKAATDKKTTTTEKPASGKKVTEVRKTATTKKSARTKPVARKVTKKKA